MNKYLRMDLIYEYILLNKLTKVEFCKKSNISQYSFRKIENGDLKCTLIYMPILAKTVGVNVSDLIIIENL